MLMPSFAVQWRDGSEWMALSSLPVKRGRWRHSERFSEVHAAAKFGLTPSQFWECSIEDQAWMVQYCSSMTKMEAWDAQQERGKASKSANKGPARSHRRRPIRRR